MLKAIKLFFHHPVVVNVYAVVWDLAAALRDEIRRARAAGVT
jgi:hypothetical protein